MGRIKYTSYERTQVTGSYIETARRIMDEEGIEQVTIRKVAKLAQCNSATMYLYFRDVDELITLAAMSHLEDYCRSLSKLLPTLRSSYEVYICTWNTFCDYAFSEPHIYYRLFYGRHNFPLAEIVERYYSIYPDQLNNMSGSVYKMLLAGDILERNERILAALVEDSIVRPEESALVNEITVCYFRNCLETLCNDENECLDAQSIKENFMTGLEYLLRSNK